MSIFKNLRKMQSAAKKQGPQPILTYCRDCKKMFAGAARIGEMCPHCGSHKTSVP